MATYSVRPWCYYEAEEKLAKLAKRAARHGIEMTWTWGPVRSYTETQEGGMEKKISVRDVAVTVPIFVPGWAVVGVANGILDPKGNQVVITRSVTGEALASRESMACDHCGATRARKQLIALREESTGSVRWVGKGCVRDYTGHSLSLDPAAFLGSLDGEMGLDGWWSREPGRTVLEYVALAIYTGPFVPTSAGYGTTKQKIEEIDRNPLAVRERKVSEALANHGDEARAAIAWVESLDSVTLTSDYLANLHRAVSIGYTHESTEGLLASLHSAYLRELARQAEKAAQESGPLGLESRHVGKVGERLEVTALYYKAIPFEGTYGGGKIRCFVMDDGARIKAFHTGSFGGKIGERVNLRATVKKHEVYQGVRETVVNRPVAK